MLISFNALSQTDKWGLSYTVSFDKFKDIDYNDTYNITVHNINVHYSILSWASKFQFGPLISIRTFKDPNGILVPKDEINYQAYDGYEFYEATSYQGKDVFQTDFQLGLNLGYNFSENFALTLDTYIILDDFDDTSIVYKPSLEFIVIDKLSAVLGITKYQFKDVDWLKGNGFLFGLKYKL